MAANSQNRFLAALREKKQPLVIAHRGDSAHAPENTLEAARLGWESGADAWELDVQRTLDGVPVVVHDESLLRTTDVLGKFPDDPRAASGYLVSEFTFDEIRRLDAGSWFLSESGGPRTAASFGTLDRLSPVVRGQYTSGAVRIPTLRECLELTARLDWLVNIELKTYPNLDPEMLETVTADIESVGIVDRVLLSSFNHRDVARAARRNPRLATGALTETPLHHPGQYVREIIGADCFHTSALALGSASDRYRRRPGAEQLDAGDMDDLIGLEIPLLVYTVNDARPDGLAVHLSKLGASGLFSDDPAAILRILDRANPMRRTPSA